MNFKLLINYDYNSLLYNAIKPSLSWKVWSRMRCNDETPEIPQRLESLAFNEACLLLNTFKIDYSYRSVTTALIIFFPLHTKWGHYLYQYQYIYEYLFEIVGGITITVLDDQKFVSFVLGYLLSSLKNFKGIH